MKRETIDASDALLLIIVGRDGMADIKPGRGVTPEYVALYLNMLARRFHPDATSGAAETSPVRLVELADLRSVLALADLVEDVSNDERAARDRVRNLTSEVAATPSDQVTP